MSAFDPKRTLEIEETYGGPFSALITRTGIW